MASYHLSIKTISRSEGRSATGAAAYRSAEKIIEQRTGEVHDYTRKSGVESVQLFLPAHAPGWAYDRCQLWNAAEAAETRKNSTVAREFEIALPAELNAQARQQLAYDLAHELVARHGCAVDVAIHAPSTQGDQRNHHAHLLCSTRRLRAEGFTEKTRELDERTSGEVVRWRARFAELQNQALAQQGIDERVDHRRLSAQGIDRPATQHLGPSATGYERRTGAASQKRQRDQRRDSEWRDKAAEAKQIDTAIDDLQPQIDAVANDLAQAKAQAPRAETETPPEKPVNVEHQRRRVNQAFRDAVAKRPAEPEQHAPVRLPEQHPGETAQQTAERLKRGYLEQQRIEWRHRETERQSALAARYRAEADQVRQNAPKKPVLWGKAQWRAEHQAWQQRLNQAQQQAEYHQERSQYTPHGVYDQDSGQEPVWQKKAQAYLEQANPELMTAVARERQQQRQAFEIKKLLSRFKVVADRRKRNQPGYRDDGKHWQALPEPTRAMIDAYNAQSPQGQTVLLNRIEHNLKKSPEAVKHLAAQLHESQAQERDRGFER
jgi:MobA/MobL family